MTNTTKFSLQAASPNTKSDFEFWQSRFQAELQAKIQSQARVERSFRLSPSQRVVPDHFSFVFWKAPFIYDRVAWQTADAIMPNLYRNFISSAHAFFYNERADILSVLINYAVWKGRFSWLYSLASLYYQYGCPHSVLFQITSLCLAYNQEFTLAKLYCGQVKEPSPYYSLYFQMLMGYSLPDSIRSTNPSQVRHYANEEELVNQYAALTARGQLFRANRLILTYLKKNAGQTYLLDMVLKCYLQNQKYYAYLLRIMASKVWPGERSWYEIEYCIGRLNLEADKSKIWLHIQSNKQDKISLPNKAEQQEFNRRMQEALQNHSQLPEGLSFIYEDIVLDRYVSAIISEPCMLRRRYALYRRSVVEPLRQNQEIVPHSICLYGASLFWTFYTYFDLLKKGPGLGLLESLAGRIIALRVLLGVYYFQDGAERLSERLLFSAANPHPMVQTIRMDLSMKKGQVHKAEHIARRLTRLFPRDPALHRNHAIVLKKIGEQPGTQSSFQKYIFNADPHKAQ